MLLDKVFKPFIEEKPLCVMAQAVLQRILEPHHLDQLFARTAKRQDTHEPWHAAGFLTAVVARLAGQIPGWQPSGGDRTSLGQMARLLQDMACQVSLQRYRKRPRRPKKPPPPRRRYKHGEHVATSQLIGERKRQ